MPARKRAWPSLRRLISLRAWRNATLNPRSYPLLRQALQDKEVTRVEVACPLFFQEGVIQSGCISTYKRYISLIYIYIYIIKFSFHRLSMCFSPILLLYESLHHSPLASRPATFSFALFRSGPIPDLAPKRVRVVALYVMGGRQRLLGGDA